MRDKTGLLSDKRAELELRLADDFVLVHIDPSVKGTLLPKHLMRNPSVTLKLSHSFRGTLQMEGDLVKSDLLFGPDYFSCVLPLDAIWAITCADGENKLWPQTPAQQVLANLLVSSTAASTPQKKQFKLPKKSKASHLRRVK